MQGPFETIRKSGLAQSPGTKQWFALLERKLRLQRRCDAGLGPAVSCARAMIYARIASTSFLESIFWKDGIPAEARSPSSTIAGSESSTALLE